jgi:L-asparagine permease
MIMICHLLFWQKTQKGELTRPGYQLPGSPWTELVTLFFLASVLVLMYADGGVGRTTVRCLPLIVAALVAGWYAVRRNLARTDPPASSPTSSRADA